MALGTLVERAGQALFGQEWLEPIVPSETRKQAERQLRLNRAYRARLRAGGEPTLHPELVAWFEAIRKRHVRTKATHDRLRLALCTGAIPSALKLPTGQLVEVPAYFWQSSGAIPAFIFEEATVDHGHGVQYRGRVLVQLAEAEDWIASLNRAPATATPEAKARDWFLAEVGSGKKRFTRDEYRAEMVRRCDISNRAAGRIWDEDAPEDWKKRGAPNRTPRKTTSG
jgi:hypothetical protein